MQIRPEKRKPDRTPWLLVYFILIEQKICFSKNNVLILIFLAFLYSCR